MGFTLTESSYIGANQAIEIVQPLVEKIRLKSSLLEEKRMKRIGPIQDRIERFYDYLLTWKNRDIPVADYIRLRTPKYPELIDRFKEEYSKYQNQHSEEQHTITIAKLREIESKELTEIYGGPHLQTAPLL